MPHLIVEYSDNLDDATDLRGLLAALHDSLGGQPGIDKARVKTRAVKLKKYLVGHDGTDGHMVHATLLLLAGRDAATKQSYAAPLHGLMKQYILPANPGCAITLEIRDMDPATYLS